MEIIMPPESCFMEVMITLLKIMNCNKSHSRKQQDNTDHINNVRQLWLYTCMISDTLVFNGMGQLLGLVATTVTTHSSWANVPTSFYPTTLLCMLQSIISVSEVQKNTVIIHCSDAVEGSKWLQTIKLARYQAPTPRVITTTITTMLAVTSVTLL